MPRSSEREAWLVCPSCGYDLNGLVDGRCPECGWEYTRAGLHAFAVRKRQAWLDVPPWLLAALGSFAALFSCWVSTWRPRADVAEKQLFLTLATVLFGIAWAQRSAGTTRYRAAAAVWLLLPIAAALTFLQDARTLSEFAVALVLVVAAVPIAVLIGGATTCRGLLRAIGLLLALGLFGYGVSMVVVESIGWTGGAYWSTWNPPFRLERNPPYPMTSTQGMLAGMGMVLAAGLLLLVTARALRQSASHQDSVEPTRGAR